MAKEKRRKMWLFIAADSPLVVIKAVTEQDAKRQLTDSFHNPDDVNKYEVKELTIELLDEVTNRPEFAEVEYEFIISPGGDF